MENIYLTSRLKQFYLDDFESLNTVESEFWKIDPQIYSQLAKINRNSKIQTLYSKYGADDNMLGSYLEFCYSKDIEEKLFKWFIPRLLEYFNDVRGKSCIYDFHYPHDNNNYDGEVMLGSSATDNPDHFQVNHLRLCFRSYNRTHHDEFWEKLSHELEILY